MMYEALGIENAAVSRTTWSRALEAYPTDILDGPIERIV